MIDSIEIPTAILGFSTMSSSKKVPQIIAISYDNDRQPESNMADHTVKICICGDIVWGQVRLGH